MTASTVIDAKYDFGVKADNATDDTQALQSAINAASSNPYGVPGYNDHVGGTVRVPPGRIVLTGPLLLPPNVTVEGLGASATYLVQYAQAGATIQLATGAETQTCIRDLGIIINSNAAEGINLTQNPAASILGDSRHVIQNVVVVGGRRALYCTGNTEGRFDSISAYRQRPPHDDACVYIGGSDHMISRITVGAPEWNGTSQGGAGIRTGVANCRIVNCKVFGGTATAAGTMQPALYMAGDGGRNQVIGFEAQDYAGSVGIEDDGGSNIYMGGVIDSCQSGGLYTGAPMYVRGMLFINRGGGRFAMPYAVNIYANAGADIECVTVGIPKVYSSPGQSTGNRVVIYGVLQP